MFFRPPSPEDAEDDVEGDDQDDLTEMVSEVLEVNKEVDMGNFDNLYKKSAFVISNHIQTWLPGYRGSQKLVQEYNRGFFF